MHFIHTHTLSLSLVVMVLSLMSMTSCCVSSLSCPFCSLFRRPPRPSLSLSRRAISLSLIPLPLFVPCSSCAHFRCRNGSAGVSLMTGGGSRLPTKTTPSACPIQRVPAVSLLLLSLIHTPFLSLFLSLSLSFAYLSPHSRSLTLPSLSLTSISPSPLSLPN